MLPDWSSKTVICIASGPSLTPDDCEIVRASGHPAIVTNTTFKTCPWAHALFGWDEEWWAEYIGQVRAVFTGRLFSKAARTRPFGVEWLGNEPRFVPFSISGACAISLAICAGAARVVALGYDSQRTDGKSHHHGDHPNGLGNCESMPSWPLIFERLAVYASSMRVPVLNASRETVLTCFERRPLGLCL
jgi:hypothetical protein